MASRKFEVLRFQPDDDVNVAAFISVTFTALSRSRYDYPYVAQPTMPDELRVAIDSIAWRSSLTFPGQL